MSNKRILTKTLAGMLAFILIFANVLTFVMGVKETYASSQELEEQNTEINNAVSFDAYFKKKGEVSHSKEINVASTDKLYVKINVSDGYLKDSVIELKNANFKILKSEKKSEIIQNISVEESKVYLNRIDKGQEVTLEFDIELNKESNFAVKSLDDTSKVALTGTFVNVKESISSSAKSSSFISAVVLSSSVTLLFNLNIITNKTANIIIAKIIKYLSILFFFIYSTFLKYFIF